MDRWPEGEYFESSFHGHYLTRNRKRGWDESSYTIVANAHHVPLHPMGEPMRYVKMDTWELVGDENRRLSWRECAAIQGLPYNCEPSGTLIDKYRIVGNAVPPIFGEILIEPITGFENGLISKTPCSKAYEI
jgi:DNA (cytosine-5)-methyltransferase 1